MIGNPKYKEGDKVKFLFSTLEKDEETIKEGIVYIVDKYGTLEDSSDVSYDILIEEENMLYKHIREDSLI